MFYNFNRGFGDRREKIHCGKGKSYSRIIFLWFCCILDSLLDNYIILRLQLDNNIKKFGLLIDLK